jgi:3-demethoxyubiquinol 3-hydroxylase
MDHTQPLPTDSYRAEQLAQALRVNQAGEYGARRIYEGQLAVLRDRPSRQLVQHMAEQEQAHLDYFNEALVRHRVRPTLLQPLWHVGGFLLGAATAALGREAAMACTVAVESVIDEHYHQQEQSLAAEHPQLVEKISAFRADEKDHHDTGLQEGAEQAVAYPLLYSGVRGITKFAIALSKRL